MEGLARPISLTRIFLAAGSAVAVEFGNSDRLCMVSPFNRQETEHHSCPGYERGASASGYTAIQDPVERCTVQVLADEDELAQAGFVFCPEPVPVDCETVIDSMEDGASRRSFYP